MAVRVKSLRDKRIWNRAVEAAKKQILLYDGLIPDDTERK